MINGLLHGAPVPGLQGGQVPGFPLVGATAGDGLFRRRRGLNRLAGQRGNGEQVEKIAPGDQRHGHFAIGRQRHLHMHARVHAKGQITAHRAAVGRRRLGAVRR